MSKRTRPTTTSETKKPRHSPPASQQANTFSCSTTTTSDSATLTVLERNRDYAVHYEAQKSTITLLPDVWSYHIIPFLHIRERGALCPTCKWFDKQWHVFLERKLIRVPEDISTIDGAMKVGHIFSKRKRKIYTKEKPLVILLSEDVHEVSGSWRSSDGAVHPTILEVPFNKVSIIGCGKRKTIIHGGLRLANKKNVTLTNLTLTNDNGTGLAVDGGKASIEMMGVSIENCGMSGVCARWSSMIKATQCDFVGNKDHGIEVKFNVHSFFTDCVFNQNCKNGIIAQNGTLVELRGKKTEIHRNYGCGLSSAFMCNINIHVPSRHYTSVVCDNEVHNMDTSQSKCSRISVQQKPRSELTVILNEGRKI